MNYTETINYLFQQLPMFQRVGAAAFKKDLNNTIALCKHLGNPQQQFKSIHIAGTNGKGSTAHILAAILQTAGYKVGLYTSPHYRDFRERIKVNGAYISEDSVVDFVAKNQAFFEVLQPSFFEMTVGMAFDYFQKEQVDIAVIEVGLGGRLDSTNIINPILSIITNIGLDHEDMLGDTLELIAGEKAGIIKKNTPILVGETHSETAPVFLKKAAAQEAPIFFADQLIEAELEQASFKNAVYNIKSSNYPNLNLEKLVLDLTGNYQQHNIKTVLLATEFLKQAGFEIGKEVIYKAVSHVQDISKILGRWQVLQEQPLCICDSGHNEHGLRYVVEALSKLNKKKIHFVFGAVNDKDLSKVLAILPKDAHYYFCKANIPRGLDSALLQQKAQEFQLKGDYYTSVKEAFESAKKAAGEEEVVFVGGSIFVVAELV